MVDTKYCNCCGETKPLSDFNKNKRSKDGHYYYCSKCANKKSKKSYYKKSSEERHQYYIKHKRGKQLEYQRERRKDPLIRRKHNLQKIHQETGCSYDELIKFYNIQFKKQQGRCALCGLHESELSKHFDIDHNHSKIGYKSLRGLLCSGCNLGIGNLRDDAELCLRAYQYLRSH